MAGQPLGEQFEVQQRVRRQQRLPFLIGDHRQRVMVGALHAPVGDQLVGFGTPDDAVCDQVAQYLGEGQSAIAGGFGGGLHGRHYSGNAQPVQTGAGLDAWGCLVRSGSPCGVAGIHLLRMRVLSQPGMLDFCLMAANLIFVCAAGRGTQSIFARSRGHEPLLNHY